MTMRSYYDDNFGHWDIRDEDDVAFYHKVQRDSVVKKCGHCGRKVKIRREYYICNACADKIERGGDY
jgi:hypothetical protein